MKNILLVTLTLFFTISISADEVNFDEKKSTTINVECSDYRVEILDTQINEDYSCTRSIKVYIPTPAGIIGVGFSITADTCAEADAGIGEAVRGFISEL
jgi:hypothetical protein